MHIRQEFDMYHRLPKVYCGSLLVSPTTLGAICIILMEKFTSRMLHVCGQNGTLMIVVSQEDASLHMFLTITAVSLDCVEVDVRIVDTNVQHHHSHTK